MRYEYMSNVRKQIIERPRNQQTIQSYECQSMILRKPANAFEDLTIIHVPLKPIHPLKAPDPKPLKTAIIPFGRPESMKDPIQSVQRPRS
jgi:hypothetical protein